jgi:hypothetical protein
VNLLDTRPRRLLDCESEAIYATAVAVRGGPPSFGDAALDFLAAAALGGAPGELRALCAAQALPCAESLLARIDPVWAWSLIEEFGRASSATLGLVVAAYLEEREARALMARKIAANALFARQLEADFAARARWTATDVRRRDRVRDLFPSECNAYLAGAGLADARSAIALAEEMLQVHAAESLGPGLEIVAQAARDQGAGELLRPLAAEPAVAEAAALAGILRGGELAALLRDASPDPLPLTVAALAGGCAEELRPVIETGNAPAEAVARRLFFAVGNPVRDLPDWLAEPGSRARAVVALGPECPWDPKPETLAEIVHYRRPHGA